MDNISSELPVDLKNESSPTSYADSLTLPPWSTPSLWEEINQTLLIHLRLYHDHLIRARGYAGLIRKELRRIYPLMDELCRRTCLQCENICCCHAKPWFDFRDLIYLHICGVEPPDGQPIGHVHDRCRYLETWGCRLSREKRPWICIWYLCPEQKRLLRADFHGQHQSVDATLQQVKAHRKILEKEFIRIVTEGGWPSWDGI